jgi:DNA-directed RNA polymerase subunit RPC12/RpoP
MVEFLCPSCKALFRAEDDRSGTKMNCSKCGQRVMVPHRRNLTVLGEAIESGQRIASKPIDIAERSGASTAKEQPASPTAAIYFFMCKGQRQGPIDLSRLQRLVADRQIMPKDLIWYPSAPAWIAAEQVAGLFPVASTKRPIVSWSIIADRLRSRGSSVWTIGIGATVAICILAAFFLRTREISTELSSEQIVNQTERAVALIETPIGHGTGFLLGPGVVITNAHVIELSATEGIKIHFPVAGDRGKPALLAERIRSFRSEAGRCRVGDEDRHPLPSTRRRPTVATRQQRRRDRQSGPGPGRVQAGKCRCEGNRQH